jgi:hypothetical protein
VRLVERSGRDRAAALRRCASTPRPPPTSRRTSRWS